MRPKVLVVIGSQTQALLFKHLLEEQGMDASCVDGVGPALERIADSPPAALLVDATSLGAEAVTELRRHTAVPMLVLGSATLPTAAGAHRADSGNPLAAARALKDLLTEHAAPAAASHQAPTPAEILRRSRILVVDDSVTYREFLRLELEAEGCRIQVARNAEEAETALVAGGFDCVLLDLVMPGTNGLQLCRRFDGYRRERRLLFSIIMLTSQESDEQLIAALEAGADDFVGKSRPMEILKAKTMALLRRTFFMEDEMHAADATIG